MITFQSSVNALDILQLPNPKFGDSHTTNFKRVNRTSRGNDLILRGETNWLPTQLHKYEWEYLFDNEKILLKAFVARHVGTPVYLTGIYGESWKVIFLRPDAEFVQVGVDNRTVTLDMQEVQ